MPYRPVSELQRGNARRLRRATGAVLRCDAERTEWLAANGYRVLRFWNREVLTNLDGVLTAILEAARPEPTAAILSEKAGEF